MFENLCQCKDWEVYKLGDFLKLNKSSQIDIDDSSEYSILGVTSRGQGLVIRRVVKGFDLTMKRYQVARVNQLMWCKVDTKHGAFGLTKVSHEGALASSNMALADLDMSICLPEYLQSLFKLPIVYKAITDASLGSTNRQYLKPNDLLSSVKLQLPPLSEQRRIVGRLEHLASKIEEARGLRDEIERETRRTLFSAHAKLSKGAKYGPMAEVAPLVRRKVEVEPDGTYPELGVRSFGKGTFFKPALSGAEVGNKKLYRIEERDLIFQIVFAWEGAVAVAKPEDAGRVGSHRFLTCVPKEDVATSNYLRYYFLSPEGLEKLGKASPGGAGRNRTLAMKALAGLEVPVPPIEQQRQFDAICQKFESAKQLQMQARAELDALLPSVLDKAFRSEL